MSVNGVLGLYFLPFFLAMIAAEIYVGKTRGRQLYTKGETLASVGVALGQRAIHYLHLGLGAAVGAFAFEHKLFAIDMSDWRSWPLLFVLLEFAYYWFHRASHEVRWFWATHAVHHSIEEMNILGSYRLGWTGFLSMGFLFYVPLMWLGFPPAMVGLMLALNLFYQSWLHTEMIGKLGPLEGILNTPSAHRVHHARNADYLDRNYGGVTVVFDRLFGTYQGERDGLPCEYGLVKPVGSVNPFVIAVHEWVRMAKDLSSSHPMNWFGHLFRAPGWAPDGKGMTSDRIRAQWRADHPETDESADAAVEPARA